MPMEGWWSLVGACDVLAAGSWLMEIGERGVNHLYSSTHSKLILTQITPGLSSVSIAPPGSLLVI